MWEGDRCYLSASAPHDSSHLRTPDARRAANSSSVAAPSEQSAAEGSEKILKRAVSQVQKPWESGVAESPSVKERIWLRIPVTPLRAAVEFKPVMPFAK